MKAEDFGALETAKLLNGPSKTPHCSLRGSPIINSCDSMHENRHDGRLPMTCLGCKRKMLSIRFIFLFQRITPAPSKGWIFCQIRAQN
jgi:hypothetical protein